MTGNPPTFPPAGPVTLPDRGEAWVWDSGGSERPTVVLLHGWTSTAALNWCASFGPLASTFRVIAMDHRGHGRGIKSKAAFTLEDCADDVAALIEVLGTGPVIAVGYSMGGPVASLLWRRHPDVVRGLVLCATAARFGGRPELVGAVNALGQGLALALDRIPPHLIRQGADQLGRLRRQEPEDPPEAWVLEELQGGRPAALVQAAAALHAYDATGWIDQIDVATAALITTSDRTVAPERQWSQARAIPGARLYELDADHRACVEGADVFVPVLLDACRYVAGLAPPAA